VVGLAAVLVTSLAAGCAFWRDAEPESAFDRPAVSSGSVASRSAASHADVVTTQSPPAPPVKLRARRAGLAAAAPSPAEMAATEGEAADGLEAAAEGEAVEELDAAHGLTAGEAAREAALAQAPEALPPVSEAEAAEAEAADGRPSLVLPVAIIIALGLLGVWFSGRQTSA